MELTPDPACAAAGSPCRVPPPLRSVIAWQKSDPRRIVQFTTFGPATAIDQSAATPFSVDILRLVMAPSPARTVGPAIASMLIYLLMALVLYFRPAGLFGKGAW